jgi:hypothetical protein
LAAIVVKGTLQNTGKLVEIHRLAVALFRRRNQFHGRFGVEAEPLPDDGLQAAPLGEIGVAIDIGDMHEQGSRREPVILFGKAPGERFRATHFRDKVLQGIEHQSSPIPVFDKAYRMQWRQTHPVYSAKEQTSPIPFRPVIDPAQAMDPGLTL